MMAQLVLGFLCEAHEYLKSQPNLSTSDLETLQKKTFYGKEKKGLAYVIGIMNMILHGMMHRTSFTPTHLVRTSWTYKKRTGTTSFLQILPLVEKSERRFSKTSRFELVKQHTSSCEHFIKCSERMEEGQWSSRTPSSLIRTMHPLI